jgi:AcrR family transcriptional regulator
MEGKKRRDEIVEASARVFARKGYFAASVSDIIEEAGIARGTFYLYFTSKREVFTEVLQKVIDATEAEIKNLSEDSPAGEIYQNLHDNVARVIGFFLQNPDLAKIVLTQAPGLDEESTHQLDQANFMLQVVCRRLLRRGQELGLLREFNADIGASSLLGGIKELLYQLVVIKQIDAPLDVVVGHLVRIQAAGILRPELAARIPQLAEAEGSEPAADKPKKGKKS